MKIIKRGVVNNFKVFTSNKHFESISKSAFA